MSDQPSGPDPHFHRTMSEAFFVLDGVVRLHDGNRTVDARSGDFLFVPPDGIHAFRSERELSDEEWTELYARHDQYMV